MHHHGIDMVWHSVTQLVMCQYQNIKDHHILENLIYGIKSGIYAWSTQFGYRAYKNAKWFGRPVASLMNPKMNVVK